MSARPVAALLLVAAGLLLLGVTVPRRDQAAEIGREVRRLTEARTKAQAQLAAQERRAAARARAAEILAEVPAVSRTAPLAELRREVLDLVSERPLSQVRLQVQPQRPPVDASFRISASGRFEDLLGLSDALARPRAGIVLDRVRFRPGPRGLIVEVEASRLGGRR